MEHFTRRTTTKLLLAGGLITVAACGPDEPQKTRKIVPNHVSSKYPELSRALAADLNTHILPGSDGTFSVPAIDFDTSGGKSNMWATVRLDWPPGWRQRPIKGSGSTEDAAYAALIEATVDLYTPVWPGHIA